MLYCGGYPAAAVLPGGGTTNPAVFPSLCTARKAVVPACPYLRSSSLAACRARLPVRWASVNRVRRGGEGPGYAVMQQAEPGSNKAGRYR